MKEFPSSSFVFTIACTQQRVVCPMGEGGCTIGQEGFLSNEGAKIGHEGYSAEMRDACCTTVIAS